MAHFVDRLLEQIEGKGSPVCVGIDPVFGRLPQEFRQGRTEPETDEAAVEAFRGFVGRVLDVVAEHVPCVKIQSACFERYHWRGVAVYEQLIRDARDRGLVVIGDAKRGDIGTSAAHYAAGNLADRPVGPDALTVNSYFGLDGLEPFMKVAIAEGKGLFALVRTSNPGGDAIQSLKLDDGRSVAEAVAQVVAEIGQQFPGSVGNRGYSCLGAVVGATKPGDAARLRQLMPQQLFLVPGFGAQGGSADDVRACFKPDGTGAIITASRSITYAFQEGEADWAGAIERATVEMKQQINAILAG